MTKRLKRLSSLFFFSSRRRHTRLQGDWSSDVCSSDLVLALTVAESAYVRSTPHAWIVLLAFALQIYLDFSAYSDIAIGFARTLGIRLPENFHWPYLARNVRDFWDRWHVSLSHWMRDYVFLPVGSALFRTRLRRRPAAIAAISYLTTFLSIGAWHGLTAGYLRSEEHTSELQSPCNLVCRLLLEKKKQDANCVYQYRPP